jgi:arylsulfatase A-like enzyme
MTKSIWHGLLLASFAALTVVSTPVAAQQPKKPNIVFMLMDNLGYGELGVYGGGILRGAPTPRIDTLASEGMRLLNFNVEAQCTPSRSALMTGRFSIRSGTYEVPYGGVPDGLTQWEVTIAELLSAQGYATGMWGKWHLGSAEERFPTHQGFDEWYGIPRTYDEALWPSLNETKSMWPSVGSKQGWDAKVVHPEHIYEARKGEKARQVAELNLDNRRTMEAEITNRTVDFIKRNASASKPFYAYVSFSLMHMPTLPNPEFAGKTGNGDWADCLAEMDYRTGQILDAIKAAGIEDNTVVIFASENGPEGTNPWQGDSGPWREPISQRWRLRYAHPSSFAGRAEYRRVALTTKSFISWTCTQPSRTWAERKSRRIARLMELIRWISSSANRRLPTAKASQPSWRTG